MKQLVAVAVALVFVACGTEDGLRYPIAPVCYSEGDADVWYHWHAGCFRESGERAVGSEAHGIYPIIVCGSGRPAESGKRVGATLTPEEPLDVSRACSAAGDDLAVDTICQNTHTLACPNGETPRCIWSDQPQGYWTDGCEEAATACYEHRADPNGTWPNEYTVTRDGDGMSWHICQVE